MARKKAALSIIIPSYGDGECVLKLVAQLAEKKLSDTEVLVVESKDTAYFDELKKQFSKKWLSLLTSPKGRAKQMNHGAASSTGKVLLFLHADSDVSQLKFDELKTLKDPTWGCFKIAFHAVTSYARYIECSSNIRAKRRHIVYGDQGLFITRKLFVQVGTFDESAHFEDLELSLQLKKVKNNIFIDQPMYSSARRFEKHGFFFTHMMMGLIEITYRAGLPSLAKWFYSCIQ